LTHDKKAARRQQRRTIVLLVIDVPTVTVSAASPSFKNHGAMRVPAVNGQLRKSGAIERFTPDSSRCLNHDSNFAAMLAPSHRNTGRRAGVTHGSNGRAPTGEARMAYFELPELALSAGAAPVTAEAMFELGMLHASGREVAVDLITAHKWFNIAAMKGHAEAARLRREIAGEMQDAEIGQAQRAARDWLKAHPEPVAVPAVPVLRAAA
jgi:hypothetical protein